MVARSAPSPYKEKYDPLASRVVTNIDMDVFTAAKERIRWLFKEFDGKVCVTCSGGKDSTVVLELAAMVAKEEGYGPLKVWFLDQEAEFQSTIDYIRYLAYEREDIEFHWYQVPFPMENSMNLEDPWFTVWGEEEKDQPWLREKEPAGPGIHHENRYAKPDDIFYKVLDGIRRIDFEGYITLDGMRIEESPNRRMMALSNPQYKWVTWSSNKEQPRFQPIYDWTYRDVWHAIEKFGWRYNNHYNHMYQWGTPVRGMRVSSFTHNQSLNAMLYLQEAEPEMWEKATQRFPGMATFGHLKGDQYINELPYMFQTWTEYMHHLIDNLVPDEESRETFREQHRKLSAAFPGEENEVDVAYGIIGAVISGDHHGVGVKSRVAFGRREQKRLAAEKALEEREKEAEQA